MEKPTKDVRKANNEFAFGMFETGGHLIMLACVFGGSAFFLQWAFWFIAVGWAASSVIEKGADATDWIAGKLPENPFCRNS